MPVSNRKDEDKMIEQFDELAIKDGPESWQIKDFLKQNEKKFDISNVITIPQEEKRTTFGGEKETISFDLMILKDGSVVKGNITTKKDPDGGGGNASSFSADMSNVKSPEEAKEVLSKLLDLTLETKLRFHPAGTELRLYRQGMDKWDDVARQVEEEKCAQYAAKFQEKGIKVYFNDKLMIPDAPDGDLENASLEKKREPKPWDVPRGAPDARPKRE